MSALLRIGAFAVCLVLSACGRRDLESRPSGAGIASDVSDVVTGDIKEAIEEHIADRAALGGGRFRLALDGRELSLELVRVHVEYLATLGPREHFACVDMAGADGEFYDVDFFMHGDPGAMVATKTMVHKVNGKPIYYWKQRDDRTWGRVRAEEADNSLLGIVTGRDEFEFRYRATLPAIFGPSRMWIPLAQSDTFQAVTVKSMNVPGNHRVVSDEQNGNKVIYSEIGTEHAGQDIDIVYEVVRLEKAAYAGDPAAAAVYLKDDRLAPSGGEINARAGSVTTGREAPLMKARAIYDHVIESMDYKKCGTGWGQGDALRACDVRNGNCTDYHAYFIAMCRAVGIPARFAIGASIASERNSGGLDGYHCWAEFYADGKWWPVDISEGDKFSSLAAYYFGHHPANRIELSRGRDLAVEPLPASGPINFLAYPLIEAGGKIEKAKIAFSFSRVPTRR